MKVSGSLYRWIAKNGHSLPLVAVISFGFPKAFVKGIYARNRGKSIWDGKKACLTLSFDCDYAEDVVAIPEVLCSLEAFSLKASFACVGYWIEEYPDIHRSILDGGHEIINHTYSHPDNEILRPGKKFRDCSYGEKKLELAKCHEVCKKILNYEPTGVRIPHFKHNFNAEIYQISRELGYKFSSSTWLTNTTTAGIPFYAQEQIVEFPLSVCPKHPFSVFDTWHSLHSPRWSNRIVHRGEKDYLDLFDELLVIGLDTNSYLNIYMDPADTAKMTRFTEVLKKIVDSDVCIVTYEEFMRKFDVGSLQDSVLRERY